MNSELIDRGNNVRVDDETTASDTEVATRDPKVTAKAGPSALVTLDPEAFTAAVYKPFKARLVETRAEADALYEVTKDDDGKEVKVPKFDITTTGGLKLIEALRTKFRKIRTEADKERKERAAPLVVIQKRLIEVYGELDIDVRKDEDKFQGLIDEEGARKAAEVEKKRLAEIARVDALQEKVRAISARVSEATGQSPERIAEIRTEIMAIDPTEEEFQELAGAALRVQRETCIELDRLHAAAVDQVRKDAEAEQNRLELERLRAENERTARANEIRDQIVAMRSLSLFDADPSTDLIKQRIAKCDALVIDETTFGDQHEVAQLVMAGVRDKLNTANTQAEAREKAAEAALEAERVRKEDERKKQEDTERENESLRQQLAEANRRVAAVAPVAPAPAPEPAVERGGSIESRVGYRYHPAANPEPSVTSAEVAEVVACVADLPPAVGAGPARPTDLQIVRAVADAFSVDTTTAMDWVHSIDFVAISESL